MSIKPVKAISIIGMMSDLEKVIKFCGDSGMFHPDDVMSFYSNTQSFVPLAQKNPYSAPLQEILTTAEIAGFEPEYVKPKKLDVTTAELLEYVKTFCSKTEKMVSDKLKTEQEIDKCQRKIEQVEHFVGSNIDFTVIMNCQYINPTFGRLPLESYEKLSNYSDNPYEG